MFSPNVSTITRRAYDPIVSFHGFVLRSNHERLILKRIELKRIRVEEYLARICQKISDSRKHVDASNDPIKDTHIFDVIKNL